MSQHKPPLCDQPKWNHIRHRCSCVFDHDSDEDGPIAECFYHESLRAERDEAVALLREARVSVVNEDWILYGPEKPRPQNCPLDRIGAFLAKVTP